MKYRTLMLLLFVFFAWSCQKIFIDQPENNPEAIFENLWQTFKEEYAPFEIRGVDWDKEYARYRPQVNASTSEDQLFNILSAMLATFDDGHISLTAPDKTIFFSNKIRREKTDDALFDKSVIRKHYLEPGFREDKDTSYLYGKIKNENVAYIFFDHVGPNFLKLKDFLSEYRSADGFVIDLRHNQGGDFTYCFSEIGPFTDQTRYVFRSRTKNGTGKNDYTPWKEWNIEPDGSYVDKPIVVLTDRFTISAGERAVMAFSTLPNVTILGDTTNGAHGTLVGRELANGWFYTVVPQQVEYKDGKSYEGKGLAPGVQVRNSLAELAAGVDRTLQEAIERLN